VCTLTHRKTVVVCSLLYLQIFSSWILSYYAAFHAKYSKCKHPESNPFTGLDRPFGLQEFQSPRICRESSHKDGKFFSPMHRPPLPSGNVLGTHFCWGTAVAQWLRCCATNRKVTGSIPAGVIGFFIDMKFFRSHYGPGVDPASNRNEYQEYFLGVKAAGE